MNTEQGWIECPLTGRVNIRAKEEGMHDYEWVLALDSLARQLEQELNKTKGRLESLVSVCEDVIYDLSDQFNFRPDIDIPKNVSRLREAINKGDAK